MFEVHQLEWLEDSIIGAYKTEAEARQVALQKSKEYSGTFTIFEVHEWEEDGWKFRKSREIGHETYVIPAE